MDLISTGYTSGVRNKISVITEIIREILKAQEEAYKKGVRARVLKEDIKKKGEEQFEMVGDNEFIEAVKILEEESVITCYGNKKNDKFTIKLMDNA